MKIFFIFYEIKKESLKNNYAISTFDSFLIYIEINSKINSYILIKEEGHNKIKEFLNVMINLMIVQLKKLHNTKNKNIYDKFSSLTLDFYQLFYTFFIFVNKSIRN